MKKLKYLILGLLLVTCTSKEPEPNTIRLNYTNNLPVISVNINGSMERLLVDTGASQSLIDLTLKDKIGFQTIETGNEYNGLGGAKRGYNTKNIRVTYRDSTLYIDFVAVDFKNVRESIGVIGVLGSDYLRKNQLIIDYSKNKIYK